MSITTPRIAGFVSRANAGLRRPRSVSRNISPGGGGVALHYGGENVPVSNHAHCVRIWKGWQDYHMGHHGWVDIAYTMGVCQHGYAFAGRGAGVRTAANGSNHGNNTHYAVCWIGGARQTPTAAALSAYAWCIRELRGSGGAGRSVKSHRHFRNTACAGNFITRQAAIVDGKNIAVDNNPRNYITTGDSGSEVRSWQRDLIAWDSRALPKFGADGDFGTETVEWTLRFMDSAGFSVSDRNAPRVGSRTRDAMKKALERLAEKPPEPVDEWEVFWMSLNNREKAALEELAKALVADGVKPSSFVNQLLNRHRVDIPRVTKHVDDVEELLSRGGTSLRGVIVGGVNTIDAVRDLGYNIATNERTGVDKTS